jgi:hypothetical protein
MITVLVHINTEDPVVGEMEAIPAADTLNLIIHNPRLRDGKSVSYLDRDVSTVVWPMHRINFIEIYSDEEEEENISHERE